MNLFIKHKQTENEPVVTRGKCEVIDWELIRTWD